MSASDRRAMLARSDKTLSLRRQCALLHVARSGVYRSRRSAIPGSSPGTNDAALMRRIDALFTAWPFLGSRRMMAMLSAEGVGVNRKRAQRLMRLMGIAAWIDFYNHRRPRQALGLSAPMAVWRDGAADQKAVDMMDNAAALPTCPQRQQQTQPLAA